MPEAAHHARGNADTALAIGADALEPILGTQDRSGGAVGQRRAHRTRQRVTDRGRGEDFLDGVALSKLRAGVVH